MQKRRRRGCRAAGKQADKETAAVTQLEANQAQVTNIGESVCNSRSSSSCLVAHQTWRAEQLRRRLEARAQHIKRAEESQFESYPRVGDSNSADYDVTRMCKEGARCSAHKPDPAVREGQPDAVLTQLREPSTRQSLNMWLKSQCSSV